MVIRICEFQSLRVFVKVNGYTFKRSNSAIFISDPLLSDNLLLKERIFSSERKFLYLYLRVDPTLKGFSCQEITRVVSLCKNGRKRSSCTHTHKKKCYMSFILENDVFWPLHLYYLSLTSDFITISSSFYNLDIFYV